MSHEEREASTYLAAALTAANFAEFHQVVGLFLNAHMLGKIGPQNVLDDIAAVYAKVEQANRLLREAADQP